LIDFLEILEEYDRAEEKRPKDMSEQKLDTLDLRKMKTVKFCIEVLINDRSIE